MATILEPLIGRLGLAPGEIRMAPPSTHMKETGAGEELLEVSPESL